MRGSAMGVLAAVLVAFYMAGCGRKSAQPLPKSAEQKSAVPLPEWAPKNPSPEFLRAARVLKPIPPESLASANLSEALKVRYARMICGAAYEFFGSLTDDQVQRFLTTKEIAIRVKDLTKPQRAALDAWFKAFREANQGGPPELMSDYLITLYKLGAREDLSNVRVGFQALAGGHAVHIAFWVTPPGRKETWINTWVAQV